MSRSSLIAWAAVAGFLFSTTGQCDAQAAKLLTGVNLPNATRANQADRAAVTTQLKAAGVRHVRFSFGTNPRDIEYAARLSAQGIKIDMIVSP